MLLKDDSFFPLIFLISFLEFLFTDDFRLTRMWIKYIDKFMLIVINDIRYYTFNKITRTSKGVCDYETIFVD